MPPLHSATKDNLPPQWLPPAPPVDADNNLNPNVAVGVRGGTATSALPHQKKSRRDATPGARRSLLLLVGRSRAASAPVRTLVCLALTNAPPTSAVAA